MRESLSRPTAHQLKARTSRELASALDASVRDEHGFRNDVGMAHIPYREADPDPPANMLLPDPSADDEGAGLDTDSEDEEGGDSSDSSDDDDDDEEKGSRKRKLGGKGHRDSPRSGSKKQKSSGDDQTTTSTDSSELSDAPDSEEE